MSPGDQSRLRAPGAEVAEALEDRDHVGRFGWVTDPQGTGSSCGGWPD